MKKQDDDVKTSAVKRAMVLMRSAGAEFAIRYNGQKFGTLELAPAKKARAPRTDFLGMYQYMNTLRALKPGGSAKIHVDKKHRSGLQRTICSAMSKMYGAGTYMTAAGSNHVEVLRLATDDDSAAAA